MDERERLARLYATLDARLTALLRPVAQTLALALRRAAGRDGTVPASRVPFIRRIASDQLEQIFGDSPAAQFSALGEPQTPMAALIAECVHNATWDALEPVVRDVEKFTRDSFFVRKALLRGNRAGEGNNLVDSARTWVDPNGYRLSDRIWQQQAVLRESIDGLLDYHISQGSDAVKMGKALEAFLTPAGREQTTAKPYGTRGIAAPRTLARTETARAYGQGTKYAAQASPWTRAIGWRLSASHPELDRCDQLATQDLHGLGKGNYPRDAAPPFPGHPNCLCYLIRVTVDDSELDRITKQLGQWARGEPVPGFDDLAAIASDPVAVIERLTGVKAAPVAPKVKRARVVKPKPVAPPAAPKLQPGEFRTVAQAEEWFAETYPHITFNARGMHIDVINPATKQFHKLAQDWPVQADNMKFFGTYDGMVQGSPSMPVEIHPMGVGTMAHANQDKIVFNSAYSSVPGKLLEAKKRSAASGWTQKYGGSIEGLVTHEFGHVIDFSIQYGPTGYKYLLPFENSGLSTRLGSLWNEFRGKYHATKKLSSYAVTDRAENISEGLSAMYFMPKSEWPAYVKRLDAILNEIKGARLYSTHEMTMLYQLPRGSAERDEAIRLIGELRKRVGLE